MMQYFKLLALLLCCSLASCNAQDTGAPTANSTVPASQSAKTPAGTDDPKSLTIYGYNYTDTGIGSFEVNGRGGVS